MTGARTVLYALPDGRFRDYYGRGRLLRFGAMQAAWRAHNKATGRCAYAGGLELVRPLHLDTRRSTGRGCPSPGFCDRAERLAARRWCSACVAEGREAEERPADAHVVAWRAVQRAERVERRKRRFT